MQKGEVALGISHLGRCSGKFYSGFIHRTHEIEVKVVHGDGHHLDLEDGAQDTARLKTFAL